MLHGLLFYTLTKWSSSYARALEWCRSARNPLYNSGESPHKTLLNLPHTPALHEAGENSMFPALVHYRWRLIEATWAMFAQTWVFVHGKENSQTKHNCIHANSFFVWNARHANSLYLFCQPIIFFCFFLLLRVYFVSYVQVALKKDCSVFQQTVFFFLFDSHHRWAPQCLGSVIKNLICLPTMW